MNTRLLVYIGSIKLKMHDGMQRILTSVKYVPNLKRNIISLGMLNKSGFNYKSVDGLLRVF